MRPQSPNTTYPIQKNRNSQTFHQKNNIKLENSLSQAYLFRPLCSPAEVRPPRSALLAETAILRTSASLEAAPEERAGPASSDASEKRIEAAKPSLWGGSWGMQLQEERSVYGGRNGGGHGSGGGGRSRSRRVREYKTTVVFVRVFGFFFLVK